jgi:MYXO-CTERM domain-containing protein
MAVRNARLGWLGLLVLVFVAAPRLAKADAPAPWAVCEGHQAGDSCASTYYPGGQCVEHPAEDCPGTDAGVCLYCDSGSQGDETPGDAATGDEPTGDEPTSDAGGGDVPTSDSGADTGGHTSSSSSGGGCSVASGASGAGLLALALVALVPRWRRRPRS